MDVEEAAALLEVDLPVRTARKKTRSQRRSKRTGDDTSAKAGLLHSLPS